MSTKICYLMRGLPSCGKSHTARRLAGDKGVVCETDQFFYTQVGSDPKSYDYRTELLPQARQWNFERFKEAIASGKTPVIVDRGNGRNLETLQFARFAAAHDYQLVLKEPESPWWEEIRKLLKRKQASRHALHKWADELSRRSQKTHRVPSSTIRHWMRNWKHDLTVDEILDLQPPNAADRPKGTGSPGIAREPQNIIIDCGLEANQDESDRHENPEPPWPDDPDIAKFLSEDQ